MSPSAGRPLDDRIRPEMESLLGRDLSDVRLHTDSFASRSARDLDARAYTVGRDIVFESGEFAPHSDEGMRLLAHELVHVVQQGGGNQAPSKHQAGGPVVHAAPPGRVQRQPKAPSAKGAEDEQADKIDLHPAWGVWKGGTGSVEGFQEIEANFAHGEGEGSFYHSREFRIWHMSGWRGLSKLDQPMKALQYLAVVLIPDATARAKFFADIQGSVSGGQVGSSAAGLDAARVSGKAYDAGEFIDQLGAAIELDRAEMTGDFNRVDFDIMARGRTVEKGMGDLQSFERFTLDGVEISVYGVSQIINEEIGAGRQIPQVSKDFAWIGADPSAGEMKVDPIMATAGKIPKVASAGIASRTYKLSDGRQIRREFWLRIDPAMVPDKGNRMLRLVWSQWMGFEGLPVSDPSAMLMYGDWAAGRLPPGAFRPPPPRVQKAQKSPPASSQKRGGATAKDEPHPPAPPPKVVVQEPRAILPNGKSIPPDSHSGGYHGADDSPDVVMKSGFPARGDNWDLQNHAEELWHYQPAGKQVNDSAFRGTTSIPSDPANRSGAAYIAGEGGYVYEIRGVPTWDVNKSMQGQVGSTGSFRGNQMHGEGEYAIPARVPPEKIVRWGVVKSDKAGRLYVEWHSGK